GAVRAAAERGRAAPALNQAAPCQAAAGDGLHAAADDGAAGDAQVVDDLRAVATGRTGDQRIDRGAAEQDLGAAAAHRGGAGDAAARHGLRTTLRDDSVAGRTA